jgi:hypothetical protein
VTSFPDIDVFDFMSLLRPDSVYQEWGGLPGEKVSFHFCAAGCAWRNPRRGHAGGTADLASEAMRIFEATL